jgi:hypothetical protein
MRLTVSALCVCGLIAGAPRADAAPADPIGSAVVVVNRVTAALATETRTLSTGDGVNQNEIIEVGSDGSSELKLRDATKLALGPGSRLTLDKFVYDPEQTGGSIVLSLTKGAFRFITGVAAKPAYLIRVPAASITVRGTIFDVFVEEGGASWLLLHEGGVRICNDRGTCRVHDEPGKLVRITEEGDVGRPGKWTSLPGVERIAFDAAFPFVVNPPALDPNPVFTRDEIISGGSPVLPKRPRDAQNTHDQEDAPTAGTTGPDAQKFLVKMGKQVGEIDSTRLEPLRAASSERGRKLIKGAVALVSEIKVRINERRDYEPNSPNLAGGTKLLLPDGWLGHRLRKAGMSKLDQRQ